MRVNGWPSCLLISRRIVEVGPNVELVCMLLLLVFYIKTLPGRADPLPDPIATAPL
jgi:hypothetical protein